MDLEHGVVVVSDARHDSASGTIEAYHLSMTRRAVDTLGAVGNHVFESLNTPDDRVLEEPDVLRPP